MKRKASQDLKLRPITSNHSGQQPIKAKCYPARQQTQPIKTIKIMKEEQEEEEEEEEIKKKEEERESDYLLFFFFFFFPFLLLLSLDKCLSSKLHSLSL